MFQDGLYFYTESMRLCCLILTTSGFKDILAQLAQSAIVLSHLPASIRPHFFKQLLPHGYLQPNRTKMILV